VWWNSPPEKLHTLMVFDMDYLSRKDPREMVHWYFSAF
jgi:hypothetical protein